MQVISSTDFQDWKKHPVTSAFMNSVQVRVEEAKENLKLKTTGVSSKSSNQAPQID